MMSLKAQRSCPSLNFITAFSAVVGFKHFNGTYRNTYNGNLEVIIEEKASTSGRPKKKLPGVDVLRAEKKEMTFEQMCKKYNVCRTTLYKILKSGDLHE